MAVSRRVWCSCVIIDYLQGADRAKPNCELIIEQAERRETEIVVSTLAITEVVNVREVVTEDADRMIQEFFRRSYVILAAVDIGVAEEARRLRRTYPALKTVDAIHMATALHLRIPVLETYDDGPLKLDGKEGQPRLNIRQPTYEGQTDFLSNVPAT